MDDLLGVGNESLPQVKEFKCVFVCVLKWLCWNCEACLYSLSLCGRVLWAPDGDPVPGDGSFSSLMCVCVVSQVLLLIIHFDLSLGVR